MSQNKPLNEEFSIPNSKCWFIIKIKDLSSDETLTEEEKKRKILCDKVDNKGELGSICCKEYCPLLK